MVLLSIGLESRLRTRSRLKARPRHTDAMSTLSKSIPCHRASATQLLLRGIMLVGRILQSTKGRTMTHIIKGLQGPSKGYVVTKKGTCIRPHGCSSIYFKCSKQLPDINSSFCVYTHQIISMCCSFLHPRHHRRGKLFSSTTSTPLLTGLA